MTDAPQTQDPALLLEASRVFNAAGPSGRAIAEVVSDLAVKAIDKSDPKTAAAILCDAAALRLSGRVRGGFDEALKLLDQVDPASSEDGGGRVDMLRALALGQKYRAMKEGKSDAEILALAPDLKDLAQKAREALASAFKKRPSLLENNRHFWDPNARDAHLKPKGAAVGPGLASVKDNRDKEDDLQMMFEDNLDMKTQFAFKAPADAKA
jgi:hypothetical protein